MSTHFETQWLNEDGQWEKLNETEIEAKALALTALIQAKYPQSTFRTAKITVTTHNLVTSL